MNGRFKGRRMGLALAPQDEVDVVPAPGSLLSQVVREVHRTFSRTLQHRIASHGVSMGQWYFLRALWEEDGLTQRELSQRVGMMEPTTVTALNTLERQDLVRRVRNPHDRRKMNIHLTAKGHALRDALLPCATEIADQATQGIAPADAALAIDVLRRVSANLGKLALADAGEEAG